MIDRKYRLNMAYEYLHKNCGVHTKTEFAEALGLKRPGLYSAFNGDEAYLTDKLFYRICKAYPDIFNIEYLLNGTGILLAPTANEKKVTMKMNETPASELQAGVESLLTLASQLIKENESLRRELQITLQELKDTVGELKGIHIPQEYSSIKPEILKVADTEEEIKK